jgi:hypothetical protein
MIPLLYSRLLGDPLQNDIPSVVVGVSVAMCSVEPYCSFSADWSGLFCLPGSFLAILCLIPGFWSLLVLRCHFSSGGCSLSAPNFISAGCLLLSDFLQSSVLPLFSRVQRP